MNMPETPEFGSSDAASLGGKARAEKLSKSRRSAISQKAANARWGRGRKGVILKVTHGSDDHPLRIGDIEIPCYVLQGGMRIFSQRGLQTGIGMNISGGAHRMLNLVRAIAKNDDEISSLSARITRPIKFWPSHGGIPAHGYEATILVDLCDTILQARKDKKLSHQQEHIADRCEILMRSFAKVGIIALVDEATGYQYERPRKDLEEYLNKFLSESLVRWARTFPNDYFKHLCRLKGVVLRDDMRLPQYFGHITNDLIYSRIAPGLLNALKERRTERGRASNKLHWWTIEELGHPELLLHLGTVVGLMKIHTDYDAFRDQLNKIAPPFPETPGLFDDPEKYQHPIEKIG